MTPRVREIEAADPTALFEAFEGTVWERRGIAHFERLLEMHRAGERIVLVGAIDSRPVGHVSLVWKPDDPVLRESGIPEIQDLTVAPASRRRGVASALLERAEQLASARGKRVGIGVGIHAGYGPAQRLYVSRGYVPDARGLVRHGQVVPEGASVVLDDDPVLYLTKTL